MMDMSPSFFRMSIDIATSFWLQALVYAVGLVLIFYIGLVTLPRKTGLQPALGVGLGLIAGAVILYVISIIINGYTRGDRGMGAIILLLYPLIDAVLGIAGVVTLAVCGIMRAARGGRQLPGGPGSGAAPAGPSSGAAPIPHAQNEANAKPAPDKN